MATLSPSSTKQLSTKHWKFAGAFINPNGILTFSSNPKGVMRAVSALLSVIINPYMVRLTLVKDTEPSIPTKAI